jgi:hypothetical protein
MTSRSARRLLSCCRDSTATGRLCEGRNVTAARFPCATTVARQPRSGTRSQRVSEFDSSSSPRTAVSDRALGVERPRAFLSLAAHSRSGRQRRACRRGLGRGACGSAGPTRGPTGAARHEAAVSRVPVGDADVSDAVRGELAEHACCEQPELVRWVLLRRRSLTQNFRACRSSL